MINIIWKKPDGSFAETGSADQEKGFPVTDPDTQELIYLSSEDYAKYLLSIGAVPNDWQGIAFNQILAD